MWRLHEPKVCTIIYTLQPIKLTLEIFMLLYYSDQCIELVNEMSKEIGNVNIYDIYQPCYENMAIANRAR